MEIDTASTISTREIQICEFKAGEWGNLSSVTNPAFPGVTQTLENMAYFLRSNSKRKPFSCCFVPTSSQCFVLGFFFSPLVILDWGPPKIPGPALQPEESNTQRGLLC